MSLAEFQMRKTPAALVAQEHVPILRCACRLALTTIDSTP